MAWLGRQKLGFIPLSRTNIQPPDVIPPDWPGQIMQRLFFDPATDPATGDPIPGADRSVRAYFHTVSSGLADLDVVVLPAQTIAEENVPPDALEATMGSQLRSEGFVGAAIVMLGGPGGGSTSQLSNFAWSRFCMSDNLGNWVGEILHQTNLCDLPDLFDFAGQYPSDENMGPFDQEAGYEATHISAWTKRAVGWLDPSTVALHPGGAAEYTLHSVSLIQPPPTGRIAAVQIGAEAPYLMVEARLQADQFDINIPNEGVIVYRVQTTDPLGNAQNKTAPLALLTKTALTVGQSFTTDGVTIDVGGAVLGGGFLIQVETLVWQHLSPIPGHALQADLDCSDLPNAGRSVSIGDVDGDGRAEVIVQIDAANSGGNDFWVMKFDLAAGNWQHLSPTGDPLKADLDCSGLPNAGRSVSIGDVDGDGRAEVVVQIDAANSGGNDFWVMKFDPAAFSPAHWQHLSPIPGHALEADLDCSGLPNAGRSVSIGDVDGDGRAEVIVQIDAANSGGNDFWVMKFDPAVGSWQHLSRIPGHALEADLDCSGLPNAGRSVSIGDVDGDGRAEVIVQIDAANSGGNDFWVMKFYPATGNWQHLSPIAGHALQADLDCSGPPEPGRSGSVGDNDGSGRAEVIVQIDAANWGGNDFWVMKSPSF